MNDLYRKLVDLYAGGELPAELESEMEAAARQDPALAQDMKSMKRTVWEIQSMPQPEFTEESYQRILMKVYAKGVALQTQSPVPSHLQYQLPMQG